MKKLIVLLLMILPLGAIAQEVKIAFVKTQEVFMAMLQRNKPGLSR